MWFYICRIISVLRGIRGLRTLVIKKSSLPLLSPETLFCLTGWPSTLTQSFYHGLGWYSRRRFQWQDLISGLLPHCINCIIARLRESITPGLFPNSCTCMAKDIKKPMSGGKMADKHLLMEETGHIFRGISSRFCAAGFVKVVHFSGILCNNITKLQTFLT